MLSEPVRVMQEEQILEIAKALPYRTSCRLNWSGVEVHRYRLQPLESSEHTYPQLTILLPHRPVRVEVRVAGNKTVADMSEGDVTIAPAGVPRSAKVESCGEVTAIFLDPVVMAEIAAAQKDLYSFEILPQFAIRDPLIHALGTALDSELVSAAPEPPIYAESLATALAAHILAKYSNKTLARPRGACLTNSQLRRSIEFIHENLHADVSLSEIAAAANMSKYHFAKSFRQVVGVAPHQYLVKLRIARARKLLLSEDVSVEEIAHRVGYADKSHFCAQFVKIVGITPNRYRRSR